MKKKQKKAKASHKKRSFLKIVGYIILFFFGLSVFMTLCYRWINPPVTPLMLIRAIKDGESIRKDWVPIEDISYYMISAAIASEDNNFLGHKGFDFGAIQKAVDLNKKGKRKRGASTISQQTAKNVFLWPGRSWIRKGLEVYFTFLIETFWPKDRIMEVYLNVIEMGPGIYGSEAAAQHYFHIPATKLTKRQASLITACYPNPRKRNPAKPTSYINQRAYQIAALIPKFGKIKFDKESIQKAKERYKKREEKRIKKNDGKVLAL
ncbi:MAG: monofunctional biosynthetic peptidoglycan transglycosylase [Bacteroidales bacterium]|jgi:monofunctional biosynthetic peptidoglycan transglycosylase|nr:monofunctional biosynthetic peptidoglycan transglycosylase [Bacteroidales bacterium]MDD3330311.1 monofunctional biosynthetic peptidoglycan transglycosylase [Bacteroidales bacterium]MDD4044376.1 monofunctional biosynthetic peptidoglycan transglycosylase [Bacteroidales bacterium]MDD4580871.1 monofunctional biosynthetic peptidoglycan transglycosylase [Bacteroidales bacterium]MDX9890505.1 monofunctional biosynthetic peptidoglycan transglycosylase [Bacteroidales bacterium]